MKKVRCLILRGNARLSQPIYAEDKALALQEEGHVRVLEYITNEVDKPVDTPEKPSESEEDEDPTCKGKTSKGASCGRVAGEDGYCWQHGE